MGARDLLDDLAGAGIQIEVDGERLLLAPAARLTDELRGRLREAKAELLAYLEAGADRYVLAGGLRVAEASESNFRATPSDSVGALSAPRPTPDFSQQGPAKAAGRPYALTKAQRDAAHAQPWDDAACSRFLARAAAIRRRGFGADDADDLSELAHLLDVQADGRVICLACARLAGTTATGWRCGNHRIAGMPRELAAELATLPQRCGGFQP